MMSSLPVMIYVLVDPRNGEIRYVGKTVKPLLKRLYIHLASNEQNHRTRWIRTLKKLNLTPIIRLVQIVPNSVWQQAEKYWISFLRGLGCRLVNATDGGDGADGYRHTEDTIALLRALKTGCKRSPEARANMSKGQRGRVHSPETREKIGAASRGRKLSLEHRQAISRGNTGKRKGRKLSLETRAKMSAVRKGRTLSQEHKDKISAALTGRVFSEEHRANMRAARIGTSNIVKADG